jgi:hypothetical protein
MGQFDNDPKVILIGNRMKLLGVDLLKYIGEITNTFPPPPAPWGFGFTCKDGTTYTALMQALIQNPRFCWDSMIGGSQHHGASFREDNQPNSLHIVLSTRPDPKMSKPSDKVRPTCSIHLDSVSPVAGRNKTTGQCIYDTGKLFQHLATDLKHTPLIIVPSGERGIVFGFRF